MTMKVTHPDGTNEIVPEAIRVDQQNFHEGMYDFFDERGNLLRQIDMHSHIKWEFVDEPESNPGLIENEPEHGFGRVTSSLQSKLHHESTGRE